MEARFFEDSKTPGHDLVYVKLDEHSLSYLQQGCPLRMAFFTDNNDHLPWYERNAMVVMIGSHFDLKQEEEKWQEAEAKDGVIDRSYLMASMQQVQKKLMGALYEELNKLGVSTEFIPKPSVYLGEKPISLIPVIEDIPYLNSMEASKKLMISYTQLIDLAQEGKVQAKHDDYLRGWSFPEKEVTQLLETKPDFLKKIWNRPGSIKNGGRVQKRIILEGKEYVHISEAQRRMKLSSPTITKNIQLGFLKIVRQGRSIYISKDYLKKLMSDPPNWFIKAQRYFVQNRPKERHKTEI